MTEQTILWVTTVAMLVVVGGAMALTPTISDATVPLGVRVPSSRIHDPAVRDAVRRFRLWCAALTAIAVALSVPWHTVGALLVLTFALMAACMVAWGLTRRPLIAAKRSQGWYGGVPVRLSAPVGRDAETAQPIWALHTPAVLLGIASLIVTAVRYPSLPDPYPTHWNGGGVADACSPKSWGTVLMLPLVVLGMAAALTALAVLVSRGRLAVQPHAGDWALSADQQRRIAVLLQRLFGASNLLVALMLAGMSLAPVLGWGSGVSTVLTWGGVGLLILVVIVFFILTVRIRREPGGTRQERPREQAATTAASGVETPDDDRLWWGGLFYVNRDDPSFVVPRRAGTGYDLNLGNPWGLAVMVGLAVIVLALTVGILIAGI